MTLAIVCAVVFAALLAVVALFQLALAAGAPWGRLAWGGQHPGRLPAAYRIGSVVAALAYALIAVLALDRAGAIDVLPAGVAQVGMWIVFGILAAGVLLNALSRSSAERFVMTPVAYVLALLALVVAVLGG